MNDFDLAAQATDIDWRGIAAKEIQRRLGRYVEMRDVLQAIVDANDEFRASLPDGWDGDPVNDACERAKAILTR